LSAGPAFRLHLELKLKHLAEPPVPKIFAEEVREVEDATPM
jgi:hypothetical protein